MTTIKNIFISLSGWARAFWKQKDICLQKILHVFVHLPSNKKGKYWHKKLMHILRSHGLRKITGRE